MHQLRCNDEDNDGVNDQQQHNATKTEEKKTVSNPKEMKNFQRIQWIIVSETMINVGQTNLMRGDDAKA